MILNLTGNSGEVAGKCYISAKSAIPLCGITYTVLQKYAHIGMKQNLLRSTTLDIITRLLDNAALVCVHVVGRFSKDFSELPGLRSRGFQLQVKWMTTVLSSLYFSVLQKIRIRFDEFSIGFVHKSNIFILCYFATNFWHQEMSSKPLYFLCFGKQR